MGFAQRRILIALFLALGALTPMVAGGAAADAASGPTPVASVDLSRYIGGWYQIAAVPAIYEAQCAKNSTANYVANPDGTIGVTNRCVTWWGGGSTVKGSARVENAPADSVLTVSFVKAFGHWLYFGGPNYLVIGLDPGYQWAVVTDPDRRSGFVLSRTPALTASQKADVLAVISANGFAAGAYKYTPQDGGAAGRGPFN